MSENKMILFWSILILVLVGIFFINPVEYKLESAKGLGDTIRIGDEVINQESLNAFVEKVAAKKPGDLRIVNYTEAGDAVIERINYDGYNIKITTDFRRDKSIKALWKIKKEIYSSIEKVPGASGVEYYLTVPEGANKLVFIGE